MMMPDATHHEQHNQDNADSAFSQPIVDIDPGLPVATTEAAATNGNGSDHVETEAHLTEPKTEAHETPQPALSSKKRKFDELHNRSRSTSRAVSPPWRAFAADGPTQFTENGKRRSGRVNYIPLELQPPSDKRTTRAAHGTAIHSNTNGAKHDSGKLPKATSSTSAHVKTEVKTSPARKLSASKPSQAQSAAEDEHQPTRSSSRPKTAPKHFDEITVAPADPPQSPPQKRKPGRPRRDSRPAAASSPPASPALVRPRRAVQSNVKEDAQPSHNSPRLRLKIARGPIHARHPDCIPKPSKYGSLIEVLETFDLKEKESGTDERDELEILENRAAIAKVEQTPEEAALAEAKSRLRVLEAAKPGGALSTDRCSLFFADGQAQPPPVYSHTDHLWVHGAYFGLLLRRERAKHIELAKKTAYACQAKWKEKQPRTAEELEKEENEWFRLTYKQTVKDVQRKWELVTGEIERRRLASWIEEQELTRDRKMQRLLDSTTKMLDRRRLGAEDSEMSIANEEDEEQSDEVSSEGDDESGDSDDESGSDDDDHVMSSSESESEQDDSTAMELDENLSPEALRAKYANIPDLEREESASEESDVESDDPKTEPEVEDMSHVVLEEVDNELMDDDDDESTDMSDDMGSSEEEEDEGEDDESSEEEEDSVGMMGFLGGKERRKIQEIAEDDDDAAEVDTPVQAEHETPQVEEMDLTQDEGFGDAIPAPLHIPQEGDHSSQPTPMDDSTTAHTEAESTTTIDPEDPTRIMPSTEETHTAKKITTKIPGLLRGTLREYQHYGLDWLAKLYVNQTNGILADEMGLGKTIQTIALLAHLAEEHEVWGPHLIVVPTSVILNWEMEFKKFLPGFKVLSYYGTQEERQQKRKGWANPDNYNVVITSYQLILKDLSSIRVPEWHYMILDEAHNIKNFQSQRYQAMIRLKTHARLLLTGTPLQNSIQELWSLLTFLTAGQDGQGMGDLDEFTQWFKRPVDEIFVDGKNKLGVEAQEIVNKLHHSLRPYILRRMKAQVEQQLPGKYEHTVFCRLSKRQRQLYDAFLSRADVKEKLSSGNPISVSQALMALRKVCNHPDLFEERPIVTSFTMRKPYSRMPRSVVADFEIKDLLVRRRLLDKETRDDEFDDFIGRNFDLCRREKVSKYHVTRWKQLSAVKYLQRWRQHYVNQQPLAAATPSGASLDGTLAFLHGRESEARIDRLQTYIDVSDKRLGFGPVFGQGLVKRCTIRLKGQLPMLKRQPLLSLDQSVQLPSLIQDMDQQGTRSVSDVQKFACVTPNAIAHDVVNHAMSEEQVVTLQQLGQAPIPDPFHEARVRLSIAFPDKRLLQYDCGKLQRLAVLLRELTSKGSRALIFTQMTAVLDILERFLNIHGYKYMRLDGSTRIEQRQDMMERFNRDDRVDVFILSSRSGGVGMNLTGADSVIFYDLDWNPQMDKQCQDRAHRIGQTRDVHIYKLVSEHTIEVNILKKSNQKRMLDEVVIQEGEFTTDFFNRQAVGGEDAAASPAASYDADDVAGQAVDRVLGLDSRKDDVGKVLAAAEDAVDVEAAKAQQKEAYMDDDDFEVDGKTQRKSGVSTPAAPNAPGEERTRDQAVAATQDGEADVVPHVDEYMLRFVAEAFEGVPFVPPVDKSRRGRLDKHGRDRSHRPKKL